MNISDRSRQIMKESRKLFDDIGENKIVIREDDYIVTIEKAKECKQAEQSKP